jgi:Zn-dependent protease
MIFAEPPTTRYDLSFRLAGVPVRVHPFFWLATIMLSIQPGATAIGVAIWLVAVFLSILVHEYGHAVALQRYGYRPRITLHGCGGLASGEPTHAAESLPGKRQIIVSVAGPAAGFAFAGLVAATVHQLGYQAPLVFWHLGDGAPIPSWPLLLFVSDLMVINVVWGLFNLLPVHPLDGGQIALEVLRLRDPGEGVLRSVWLSFFTALLVAVLGLFASDTFLLILFGYLAFMSWQVLSLQFHVGFGSLGAVRWTQKRWRKWQTQRRRRAVHVRLVEDVKLAEEREAEPPSAELIKEADELLNAVTEEIRRTRKGDGSKDP